MARDGRVELSAGAATTELLQHIGSGEHIERRLIDLAAWSGTPIEPTAEQPERYATNRVALSQSDRDARQSYVKPLMRAAGMEVHEHPCGLIGITAGTDPALAPLVRLSHVDTVPDGDMYDGTLGVLAGIEIAGAMRAAGIKSRRTIIDLALTGEESSGFGFATFGSQAMFHGLSDRELAARKPGGATIGEMLTAEEQAAVRQPIFGPNARFGLPHAVVELHVEQGTRLTDANKDLGVVEAIAAPLRHIVTIGSTALNGAYDQSPLDRYLRLAVRGQAGHSGATPMGSAHRADGLVGTAEYLLPIINSLSDSDYSLAIGVTNVDNSAINKIPGLTTTELRLRGNEPGEADRLARDLIHRAAQQNRRYAAEQSRFGGRAVRIDKLDRPAGPFLDHPEMRRRQAAALALIKTVNQVAGEQAADKVVGTVGTYETSAEGIISLGLDVRGIDGQTRNLAMARIRRQAERLDSSVSLSFGDSLAGSGDPVPLDSRLVAEARAAIEDFNIGTSQVMFSAAGHDAQNAARAGIPSVMIFCQSHNQGLAHHPDAYTAPANLRQGVLALAALTMRLAA